MFVKITPHFQKQVNFLNFYHRPRGGFSERESAEIRFLLFSWKCFSTFENVRIVENFLSKKREIPKFFHTQNKISTGFPHFLPLRRQKAVKYKKLSFSVIFPKKAIISGSDLYSSFPESALIFRLCEFVKITIYLILYKF